MDRDKVGKEFLGVGWKFPVEVDQATGRVKTSSYEEDIKEAIRIILMTRKGERMMEPEFGCDVWNYVFETTDVSSLAHMQREILNALVRWEPRITEIQVQAVPDANSQGKLNLSISYVVRATNNPYNLVFPYYMNEGFGEV